MALSDPNQRSHDGSFAGQDHLGQVDLDAEPLKIVEGEGTVFGRVRAQGKGKALGTHLNFLSESTWTAEIWRGNLPGR